MRSLLFSLALAACAHAPEYRGKVNVASSALIKVDPEMQVVADSDKPMFFIANAYWMFHDASWYRAGSVQGPWVKEHRPPWQVRKIDQPYAYTHYRRSHPREQTAARTETPSTDLSSEKQNRMFDPDSDAIDEPTPAPKPSDGPSPAQPPTSAEQPAAMHPTAKP
jgi:hypothetical protein